MHLSLAAVIAAASSAATAYASDAFDCTSTSIFLNLLTIVSEEDFTIGGVSTTYTTFDAYKSSSLSGSSDGRFSFKRVDDGFSCQGSAMLSLDYDGSLGGPNNQIYASSVCDPLVDNPESNGYITPGGITAGFGDLREPQVSCFGQCWGGKVSLLLANWSQLGNMICSQESQMLDEL